MHCLGYAEVSMNYLFGSSWCRHTNHEIYTGEYWILTTDSYFRQSLQLELCLQGIFHMDQFHKLPLLLLLHTKARCSKLIKI